MYITIFPFMASFSRKHVKFERILDFKVSHGRRSMSRFSLFRINCVMRCVFACSFSFLFAFRESCRFLEGRLIFNQFQVYSTR